MKKILVSIVSYNSALELKKCISSIKARAEEAQLKPTIVVVDNCSKDSSVKVAKNAGAKVIVNKVNLGFAVAVNQGIKVGIAPDGTYTHDYYLILNPDTEMQKNSLARLLEGFDQEAKIGAVGPSMLDANKKSANEGYYMKAPTWLSVTLFSTVLRKYFINKSFFVNHFYQEPNLTSSHSVEQIPGACMLIPADALKYIGLLDEDFAIWFEDVEWSYRARKIGYTMWFCSDAKVLHTGGVSFEKWKSLEKAVTFYVSMKTYFKKSKPFFYFPVLVSLTLNSLIMYVKSGDKSNLAFIRKVLRQKKGVLPN